MREYFIILALIGSACGPRAPGDQVAVTDLTLGKMRSALRAVSSAQEEHYAKTGKYAAELDTLRQYPSCRVNPEVAGKFLGAGKNGWAAETTHPALPGKSCVYWVGSPEFTVRPTTAFEKRDSALRPGQVVCDLDPAK